MEKPEIDFVDPEPPTDLVITDLVEGDGPEAAAGNFVEVHYVGVAHDTGEEFDASSRSSSASASVRSSRAGTPACRA
jgi:peptidylprolyl isomerase